MSCDPGYTVSTSLSALIVGIKRIIQTKDGSAHVVAARKLLASSQPAPSRKNIAYCSRSSPRSCCSFHDWVENAAGTGVVTLLLLVVGLPWTALGALAVAEEGLGHDHARTMGSRTMVSRETSNGNSGTSLQYQQSASSGASVTRGTLSLSNSLRFPQGVGEFTPELERTSGLDPKYLKNDDVHESVDSSSGDEEVNGRDDIHSHYIIRKEEKQQYSLPLRNMDTVQYFGEVLIGEPPQLLKILFDTGSSDTWVPGVGCTSCGLHSAFDDLASSTAVSMGRNFSNRYDSGSVAGSVIEDGVTLGGLTVEGVEMGLVSHQEQHIQGFKADGIVGLAFPSISTTRNTSPSQHSTFVQLLQEQWGGAGDIFSVYLTPSPNQPGSMVIFGGYDLDLVRRDPVRPTARLDNRNNYGDRRRQQSLDRDSAHLRGGRRGHDTVEGTDTWEGDISIRVWDGANRGGVTHKSGSASDEGDNSMFAPRSGMVMVRGEGGEDEGQGEGPHEPEEEGNREEPERRDDEFGDDPVIVWTPVVEYRGSLSYWTVELTGLRTEKQITEEEVDEDNGNTVGLADLIEEGGGGRGGKHVSGSGGVARKSTGRVLLGRDMCAAGCQAIVDTGSSLLVPPKSKFREVVQHITEGRSDCVERHGMVSCGRCRPSEFPDIVISVAASAKSLGTPMSPPRERHDGAENAGETEEGGGGAPFSQEFRLKPSDYLSQSWDGCELLIGEGRATDIWTLGDAFIKTYMTIFDVANQRVGFVCADGGRCLGGAAPTIRLNGRMCLPSFWPTFGRSGGGGGGGGGGGANDGPADFGGMFCAKLYHTFLTWGLVAVSVLLVVVGFLLWDAESRNDRPAERIDDSPGVASFSAEHRPSLPVTQHHTYLAKEQQLEQKLEQQEQLEQRQYQQAECRGVSRDHHTRVERDSRIGDGSRRSGWIPRTPKALLLSLGKTRVGGRSPTAADVPRLFSSTHSPSDSPPADNKQAFDALLTRGGDEPPRFWSERSGATPSLVLYNGDGIRSRGGTPRCDNTHQSRSNTGRP